MVDEIACEICCDFIGQQYQCAYAVHQDTNNLHIHFVYNSVSFIDGHRYYGTKKEYYDLVGYIKGLLCEYGIYELHRVSNNSNYDIQNS